MAIEIFEYAIVLGSDTWPAGVVGPGSHTLDAREKSTGHRPSKTFGIFMDIRKNQSISMDSDRIQWVTWSCISMVLVIKWIFTNLHVFKAF